MAVPRGRPNRELVLDAHARRALEELLRFGKPEPDEIRRRAKVVLEAASGKSNAQIAGTLGVSENTVGKWRARYLDRGIDGLLDHAGLRLAERKVRRIIEYVAATKKKRRLSTREIALTVGVSQSSVVRIVGMRRR